MEIEARDHLNNNNNDQTDLAHLHNGKENGVGIKDIELPLIKRTDGSIDLENGKVIELTNGQKVDYEHNEVHEFIEGHGIQPDHSTTYLETLVHLFKGNIGSGLFAMGDAFRNAGLLTGTVLTIVLGVICLHSQRQLVKCSQKMKDFYGHSKTPDYARTVELCFEHGPPRVKPWAPFMRKIVNMFICLTQMGFCCIYFVFISENMKQVIDRYGYVINTQTYMIMILLPIMLTCMVTSLKYLVPFSTIATFCMTAGVLMVVYYSIVPLDNLPAVTERKQFASFGTLPIYFSIAIFCFEGIALVLPLKNSMEKPHNFDRPLGVHNVGTSIIIACFTGFGFIGYLRYGEDVRDSLTLNLPQDEILSQLVKLTISVGILLGYSLQLHIAIEILFPIWKRKLNITSNLLRNELIFRALAVLVTFAVAEVVPHIVLLISFMGAFCSSSLALMFPPLIELVVEYSENKRPTTWLLYKNVFILFIGIMGFLTGTWESVTAIVKEFSKNL